MNLREQLIREEGKERSAYLDSRGYLTIGVGRLIDKKLGAGLSDDEIAYLLDNDIRDKTASVMLNLPWVKDLNPARQAVVIGMAFQLGVDGLLKFKNTLGAMQHARWRDAAIGMMDSLWAKQTPARARRMATQISTGEWQ